MQNIIAEVIIGTYERYIAGYQLIANNNQEQAFSFIPSFSEDAHAASVRCLASSSKYLLSGSTDETIRIFDLIKRKDVGSLSHQEGTITSLAFFGKRHAFSSSEDSTICVWDVNNWECLKTLKGHKDKVIDFTLHSSGKVMLSISADKTLRTWNLIKGRSAYTTNIKRVGNLVQFAPKSNLFLVGFDRSIDLYDASLGACIHTYEIGKIIHCICFMTNEIFAFGKEDGQIEFYKINEKIKIFGFTAHNSRIKALSSWHSEEGWILFASSSDGTIQAWHITEFNKKPELLSSIKTNSRITCLTVFNPK